MFRNGPNGMELGQRGVRSVCRRDFEKLPGLPHLGLKGASRGGSTLIQRPSGSVGLRWRSPTGISACWMREGVATSFVCSASKPSGGADEIVGNRLGRWKLRKRQTSLRRRCSAVRTHRERSEPATVTLPCFAVTGDWT